MDAAHSLEDFGCGSGAADIPVFVLRVGADDEEVVGSIDAAVACSGGENGDVASVNGDWFATFASEDEVGVTRSEA